MVHFPLTHHLMMFSMAVEMLTGYLIQFRLMLLQTARYSFLIMKMIPDPIQVDAPADGRVWGRQDEQWAILIPTGGSGTTPPVPIVFVYPGKPPTGQVINVPITIGIYVPPSLGSALVYDSTQATANAVFTLNQITAGGAVTAIGTIICYPTAIRLAHCQEVVR